MGQYRIKLILFRVPLFLRRFLGDRYSNDHIRKRVTALVDHSLSDDRNSLVEQLTNFCNDVHQFQVLVRSVLSGISAFDFVGF